jgi:chromo domain-containing protein 1
VLQKKIRLWSIGHQEAYEYDPAMSTSPPTYRFDRIEIFPHGGMIYITDDVFEQQPQQALRLIELFFVKIERCRQVDGPVDPWKRVDDGCLLWRLGVRPELMQSIYDKVMEEESYGVSA